MKTEQDDQTFVLNKSGKQSEQVRSVETDDFYEPKNKGLNPHALWRTIQRNILLITGVTTVVTAAALYLGLNSPPSYEGNFRLLVEPITSEAKLTDPSVIAREGVDSTSLVVDYSTLLQILQSPGLLSKIASQIQARYPDVSYSSLSENLVLERIGTDLSDVTKLVEVSYKGEDPNKVQFVLEELVKGYLRYSLEDRKTRIGGGVQFIEDQLPELQQRVDKLEGELQALQQRYKMSDPTTEGAALSEEVRATKAQKLQTQGELREQKTLYINLQKQIGLAPNEAIAASTLSEEPRYQELLGELKKIETQIAVESARSTEASPVMQSLREQQKNLSVLLKQETQSILGQDLSSKAGNRRAQTFQGATRLELIKQLADSANQVQVLEARNQEATKAEASLAQQAGQFPGIMRRYNGLQRQLEIATQTLTQLLTQRDTLRVEAAQKAVPWTLVSEPSVPRDAAGNPISAPSDATKKLAMGVIAGLLLGLGAAMVREKYQNVFYTTEDIQDALEPPLLGIIPRSKQAKHPHPLALAESTDGIKGNSSDARLFLEAFRSLYANIHFLASGLPIHSLVVASAELGDGKTAIALHLAQTAAGMGQRVLLVEANLHSPQLHTRLGLPNLRGLSNLLSQNLNPNDLIQRLPQEDNLFVLTSGEFLPDSTSLLASTRMQQLIEQFQTAFDLVIYDTPHLNGLTDASFLAEHTDGILMVVGIGKTNRSVVMQVLDRLHMFRLPILGIVANYSQERPSSLSSYPDRYEQNQSGRSTFPETSKHPIPDLLTSGKETEDALR